MLGSRISNFVCNLTLVIGWDVIKSTIDFKDVISLIHAIASIGRYAHEDTSLANFIRQILKFLESGFDLKVFQLHCFWEVLSLSTCSGFST